MKDTEKLLNKVEKVEKKENQIKNFSDILDSIDSLEDKKKMLWKEIYENALEDREKSKLLFNDAYISMQGGVNEHMNIGSIMSKYIERMSKSNDQILKCCISTPMAILVVFVVMAAGVYLPLLKNIKLLIKIILRHISNSFICP